MGPLKHWIEGWRVIGRYIWFQIVYGLYLIPLTILGKVLEHFTRGRIDPKHLGGGMIALLLLAVLIGLAYLPLAFYFAAESTGYLKRPASRRPWEHGTSDV
jgi:hypothetical protein